MTDCKIVRPYEPKPALRSVVLACLLLAAPFTACGPGEEETELVELEEPAATPGTAEAPPLRPEEGSPEGAPLGPELEGQPPDRVPSPGDVPAEEGMPADEEMPVKPEELEPEIEEAEPVPPAPAPLPMAESHAAGRQVFLDQSCGTCHGVSTAGIEARVTSGPTAGGDLAGVGERRDRASLEAVLRQEETVDGKRHPKRFTGSQEELDALIDWLLAQE